MKTPRDIEGTGQLFVLLAVLLVTVLLLAQTRENACAQSGGPYDLSWSTVDGGGYTFSTGGDYVLGGTAGQPDPGLLTGGDYTLGGGFWGGGALQSWQSVYLPLVPIDFP